MDQLTFKVCYDKLNIKIYDMVRGDALMDIQQLRYFCAIVETGSITKAAQDMFITQPALTKSLQKLETELGLPLFDRVKKNLVLNDAGQSAYQHFSAMLDQLSQLEHDFQKRRNIPDKIRIYNELTMFSEYLLPEFNQIFPNKISVCSCPEGESRADMLRNGHVTLIISEDPICATGIVSKAVISDELLLRIPQNSKLAKQESVRLEDIRNMPFVFASSYPGLPIIQRLLSDHDLPHYSLPESEDVPPTSPAYLTYQLITGNATCFTTVLASSYLHIPNYKSMRIANYSVKLTYYISYLKQNRTLVAPLLTWLQKRNEQAIRDFGN